MKAKFLIVLIIILCSCGRKGNNQLRETDERIKVIDLLSKPDSRMVNLSDIALDVQYLPLETSDKSMIKNISKVKIIENFIYLQNNVIEVMCFDRQGGFHYKLDKTGRGPEEYEYLGDFDISSDGNTLAVMSGHKILEFRNTSGVFAFLRSINLSEPSPCYFCFVPGSNNILLTICPWLGTEQALNILINSEGDTLCQKSNCYKYQKSDGIRSISTWDALQYSFGNEARFKDVYSDTVFSVSNASNRFIPRIIFDSHGTVVNTKARSDPEYGKNHSNDFSQIAYMSEVDRYVFYYCRVKGVTQKIIYDKVENKKFDIDQGKKLRDNVCGGPDFDLGFNSATEGKFYSFVEALALKKHVNSAAFESAEVKDPKRKMALKKLADSFKETDNPVMVIVTPKE